MFGIIGRGRFGDLAARYLSRFAETRTYDRKSPEGESQSLAEVCGADVLIICVPISELRNVLESIKGLLVPGTLVADVCSVKTYPLQWMLEILPFHVDILGTHPLFGPDSFDGDPAGRKIVLCPGRIEPERLERVSKFLSRRGFEALRRTPAEHDREVAVTLNLPQLIGRALGKFGDGAYEVDTAGYRELRAISRRACNDTAELFADMNEYNPYSGEVNGRFLECILGVLGKK